MYIREIKEKYPLVYERIVLQSGQVDTSGFMDLDVNQAFIWNRTIEGDVFWSSIHREEFKYAERLQPHLFGPDTRPFKELQNGLFKQVN